MNCLEMKDLKALLDEKGIKYEEVERNDRVRVYVNGLMQIEKPTQTDRERFWSYVRVSFDEGNAGYYVRYTGIIYEDLSIEDVMELIERVINE